MLNKTKSVPRYESYKDSGVEWLGEIPKGWSIKKTKFAGAIYNGDSLNEQQKRKYESNDPLHRAYISSKDICTDYSTIKYESGLRIPIQEVGFKIAPRESILFCIEGGSAGKKIAFTNQEVCFVNKLACFAANRSYNSKFIFYSLKAYPFQRQFSQSMTGLIGGVGVSSINNFVLTIPPVGEQSAIANYLDRKIEQIHHAIVIKEQQISLLKERKQILIQNAVTRGLNPEATTCDSGVEWIGEIPEHWEIRANRSLFSERVEPGFEGLPLLSVSIHSAVSSEEIDEEENIRGRVKIEDKSKYNLVKPNDIVFNMMRAWQGAIGAVKVKGMVSPAYIIATPHSEINAQYFEYQYRCPNFIQQMDRFSKGITDFRKRLYWNEFKQLKTLVPPIKEQTAIVTYIEFESTKIEKTIALQQQQIERLKEYKVTLINSAVTGKIKVI